MTFVLHGTRCCARQTSRRQRGRQSKRMKDRWHRHQPDPRPSEGRERETGRGRETRTRISRHREKENRRGKERVAQLLQEKMKVPRSPEKEKKRGREMSDLLIRLHFSSFKTLPKRNCASHKGFMVKRYQLHALHWPLYLGVCASPPVERETQRECECVCVSMFHIIGTCTWQVSVSICTCYCASYSIQLVMRHQVIVYLSPWRADEEIINHSLAPSLIHLNVCNIWKWI